MGIHNTPSGYTNVPDWNHAYPANDMIPHQDPELPAPSRRRFFQAATLLTGGLALGGLIEGCSSPDTDPFSLRPSWEQDFTAMPDGPLDQRYWNIDTGTRIPGYNKELEALTQRIQNVRIQNGTLILQGQREQHPYEGRYFTSGRVTTKRTFRYGKLEVDAQLPAGQGTWPAIWLLPLGQGRYDPQHFGINPRSNSAWGINGEIDICEARGSQPGIVTSTLHNYTTLITGRMPPAYHTQTAVPNSSTTFNTYGIERTPKRITFTLNGKPYHTIQKTSDNPAIWPFDQPYNLILNLALGGTYGGPVVGNGPWKMDIKTVRFFRLTRH